VTISRRSPSRRPTAVVLSGLLASLALLVGLAGPAAAADVEIDAPANVTVGTETTVTAVFTEAGEPVAGVAATLSFVGRIGGKSGWVEVASGVSDETGSVTFTYDQLALQGERMRVQHVDAEGKSQNSPFEVTVTDGPQQHTSTAGAKLGIVGLWWLLVVLAIVWTLVLLAVSGIVKIGRASDLEEGPVNVLPRFAFALVTVTALGMFYVILTRPVMHANLDPTVDFGRITPALVGTDYDYTGLSKASQAADRAGQSGQRLYIQANCAGCHGLGGLGAVVGPALVDANDVNGISLESFLGEVRDGPKAMPAYGESRLTDDEVSQIHQYLFGSKN